VVLELPFDGGREEPAAEWTALGRAAMEEVASISPGVALGQLRRWHDDGHLCLGLHDSGVLLQCRWFATSAMPVPSLGLTWEPRPGDCLAFGAVSRPDIRRRGIYGTLSARRTTLGTERGVRRSIALIAWWNRPPLKGTHRMGYRPIGAVVLWKLGPFTVHTASGRARILPGRRLIVD
jgi:hypothetical protein